MSTVPNKAMCFKSANTISRHKGPQNVSGLLLAKPPQSLHFLAILHAISTLQGGSDFGGADNFCDGCEVASTNTSATTGDLSEDGR